MSSNGQWLQDQFTHLLFRWRALLPGNCGQLTHPHDTGAPAKLLMDLRVRLEGY